MVRVAGWHGRGADGKDDFVNSDVYVTRHDIDWGESPVKKMTRELFEERFLPKPVEVPDDDG